MIKELLIKKALGKTEEDNIQYSKFILCKIHELEFLIKIEDIKEIVDLIDLTPVPGIEDSILGVLNLRGLVVPVLDIRTKFNINFIKKTPLSRYIVVDIEKESFAILVDEAQSIIEIEKGKFAQVKNNNDYLTKHVEHNNRKIGILDIKKIFLDYKI